MKQFLSCDWGTSSFRLRLVSTSDFKILAERESKEGNASIFEDWVQTANPADDRFAFYLEVVKEHINVLENQSEQSLVGIPLVMSGMASSTIGMFELPYKQLPFSVTGSDLTTKIFQADPDFPHQIILISGVKSDTDVMRGEETQMVGCMFDVLEQEQLFLHPGTHSKHVLVKQGKAVAFKSYMTGELFSLLSKESILAKSVKQEGDISQPDHLSSFKMGVREGSGGNILHELFMVRTNHLFNKLSKVENSYYLSGLLIGAELKDLLGTFKGKIVLTGEPTLTAHYLEALKFLNIEQQCAELIIKNPTEVTIKGQLQIFKQLTRSIIQ